MIWALRLRPRLSSFLCYHLFLTVSFSPNPRRRVPFFPGNHLKPASKMEASSWACSKCTFLNPNTQKTFCQVCLSPSFSASTPSSSSFASPSQWSCQACTFINSTFDRSSCEICGTRNSVVETAGPAGDDEIDGSSVSSAFFRLQRCKRKCGEIQESGESGKPDGEETSNRKVEVVSDDSLQGPALLTFKILSYNVWFREDLEVHRRMKALGELIMQHSPDFICFQEVTPNIFDMFRQSDWWKVYNCSVPNEMAATRPYFCMLLTKLPVKSFTCKPFGNSIMGRELCIADVNIGKDKKLLIATTHLESPCPAPPTWDQMFSKERVVQACESLQLLKDSPNVVFGGDMNWDEKNDGLFPLYNGWIDAWAELKPRENGWTYDTKANQMLSGNRTLQKRLDRFVCKLGDFRVSEIAMIGKEAIRGLTYIKEKKVRREVKELELPVLPSDHYGLLLTIAEI